MSCFPEFPGTPSPPPLPNPLFECAIAPEPFTWAIASDNKTIVGADVDGYFRITLVSPDRIEKCYTHNGSGPTQSIVAACYMMDRIKR